MINPAGVATAGLADGGVNGEVDPPGPPFELPVGFRPWSPSGGDRQRPELGPEAHAPGTVATPRLGERPLGRTPPIRSTVLRPRSWMPLCGLWEPPQRDEGP